MQICATFFGCDAETFPVARCAPGTRVYEAVVGANTGMYSLCTPHVLYLSVIFMLSKWYHIISNDVQHSGVI